MKRRDFISGIAAAATIAGFDPMSGSWVTEAQAHGSPSSPFSAIPALDGKLVTDLASREQRSTDAGSIVKATPLAVLLPGSANDIAKMIRFCNRFGIKTAARGQAHTTFGQGLVAGGLIIDMSTLSTIHSIGTDRADVDAGALWKDLTEQAFVKGVTPPVLTGFLGLSIGGTLSVGGISACNARGAQVDHVKELEVVTGEGDIVRCSESRNCDLFEAVLGGLGQCGIITRAVVDLVPAKQLCRSFVLTYTDNGLFFDDLRVLLERGEMDFVYNIWAPDGSGGWIYQLNCVKLFDPSSRPNDARLLRGLHYASDSAPPQDVPYLAYVTQVDAAIAFFKQIGLWDGVAHPWSDVFIPGWAAERFVGDVLPTITPEDVGMTGFMLLFPQKRSKFKRPQLRVPDGEWFYLFDILTANSVPGADPAFTERMLKRNRRLFEKARALGGTRYPIGSIAFSKLDWVRHYSERYFQFALLKRRYDPRGLLTPGVNIFD